MYWFLYLKTTFSRLLPWPNGDSSGHYGSKYLTESCLTEAVKLLFGLFESCTI